VRLSNHLLQRLRKRTIRIRPGMVRYREHFEVWGQFLNLFWSKLTPRWPHHLQWSSNFRTLYLISLRLTEISLCCNELYIPQWMPLGRLIVRFLILLVLKLKVYFSLRNLVNWNICKNMDFFPFKFSHSVEWSTQKYCVYFWSCYLVWRAMTTTWYFSQHLDEEWNLK
jgi:hypothetical protein